MGAKKRKAAKPPTHVYRCVKQPIRYDSKTSDRFTQLAQQSDRAYNEAVSIALDALEVGVTLPRVAYRSESAPAGESMEKKLTALRACSSWAAAPLGVQRHAFGEATGAVELVERAGPGVALAPRERA